MPVVTRQRHLTVSGRELIDLHTVGNNPDSTLLRVGWERPQASEPGDTDLRSDGQGTHRSGFRLLASSPAAPTRCISTAADAIPGQGVRPPQRSGRQVRWGRRDHHRHSECRSGPRHQDGRSMFTRHPVTRSKRTANPPCTWRPYCAATPLGNKDGCTPYLLQPRLVTVRLSRRPRTTGAGSGWTRSRLAECPGVGRCSPPTSASH